MNILYNIINLWEACNNIIINMSVNIGIHHCVIFKWKISNERVDNVNCE